MSERRMVKTGVCRQTAVGVVWTKSRSDPGLPSHLAETKSIVNAAFYVTVIRLSDRQISEYHCSTMRIQTDMEAKVNKALKKKKKNSH